MAPLTHLFRALADVCRLRLLAILDRGPQAVETLAHALDAPQPKISRHLAYLKRAGLVDSRRQGRHIYYRAVRSHRGYYRVCLRELCICLRAHPATRADWTRLREQTARMARQRARSDRRS